MIKKKLKIGINLLYMNRRLSGGSITYGINLVNELSILDNFNSYILYVNKDCKDLPLNLNTNFEIKIVPFYNKHVFIRYFWEQVFFPFIISLDKLDVLHSLGYVGPLICPTKHIVSILDLNFKRHTGSMSLSKRILLGSMVRLTSVFSNKILTISNFSKNEICSVLNVNENKISVTYLSGSNDRYKDVNFNIDLKRLYKIQSDYIIAFGSPSSHKNILGLILAFLNLLKTNKNISLILVGHQHSNEDLNNHIIKLNLVNKVLFTGFVPDDHVFPLIRSSKLFVFPSFYEGFGIPLLDAQSLGVPVASSNSASLPEIGNNGALYFDPHNIKEMSDVMKSILNSNNISKKLIESGYVNRSNYSWCKTASQTLDYYYIVSAKL